MRRRQGNLLLSALFMAAFLFFLSVALVVTNRQDILYTLFTDHKMRADLAAEGMLDRALNIMRNTSNWEGQVTETVHFASGAEGSCRYQNWLDPGRGGSRYAVPQITGKTSGVELIARATSGPFASERHLLLEEFRLADSVLADGKKPHLFCLNGNALKVLVPSFVWEAAGTLHEKFEMRTVSAGGGTLQYLAREQGLDPNQVLLNMTDYTKMNANGFIYPGDPLPIAPFQRGHGGFALVLKDDKWQWEVMPDPQDQLVLAKDQIAASRVESSESTDALAGGKGWDPNTWGTQKWDSVVSHTPSELTVDYSFFSGPRLSWYALTGTAAECGKGKYYCHATHFFYSGFRFKNSQTPEGGVRSQGKDAQLYEQPCILEYDHEAKKWKIVLDYLKVEDPLEEPTIITGTKPNSATMLVDGEGTVYTQEAGGSDNQWYRVGDGRLTPASLPKKPRLHFYGSEALYGEPRTGGTTPPDQIQLNRLDIAPYYPAFLPAVNPQAAVNTSIPATYEPTRSLYWSLDTDNLTSAQRDLFATVRLECWDDRSNNSPRKLSTQVGLAHYDGDRWQILPAGLALLLTGSSYQQELLLDYRGGSGPAALGSRLVLAGYATERAPLRRYVPVARWGD